MTSQSSLESEQTNREKLTQGYSEDLVWRAIQLNHEKKIGGVTPHGGLEQLPESLLLKTLLTQDYTKTIDNLRVQRLMGINSKTGKVTMESIPSNDNLPDRSMFSCERYQFFLDAPFEISNQCCTVMKKEPMHRYQKETGRNPMTAEMASESRLRTQVWLRNGCNMFDAKSPKSTPMAFWTEQDVLLYIYENHIPIASVYGDVIKENEVDGQLDFADLELFDLGRPTLKTTGCQRTGCILCGYGAHRCKKGEKGRYERLKETHPKFYNLLNVAKNSGWTMAEAIEWTNEHGRLNIR